MAVVKIDNVALDEELMPMEVRVVPPEPVVYPGPGTGKIIVQPLTPPVVELHWGPNIAPKEIIAELKAKRGRRLVHVLSWTNEDETGTKQANVYIPEIGYAQGPGIEQMQPFTLRCECLNPNPYPQLKHLDVWGTIAAGDGKCKWKTPAGGRILAVNGWIETLGTGAGQTRVQISNGATDYLSTPGDFVVASATNFMENQVLVASPTFNRGETIEVDVDAIPGGADSANLHIWLYVLLFAI